MDVHTFPAPRVHTVHQHQARVHDDPAGCDAARHRHDHDVGQQAQRFHDHVPPYCACHGEGNHRHDDQRLRVGAQRDRQQGINDSQGHEERGKQIADAVLLLAAGAFQAVADPRMVAQDGAQRPWTEIGQHLVRRDHVSIHVGGNVHHPVTVCSLDGREAAAEIGLRNRGEGHLGAISGADAHLIERPQCAALRLGVAQHDPDVVAAALNPLNLFAVERLTDLASQGAQVQPEGFSRWKDIELELTFSGAERVGDIDDARIRGERLANLSCHVCQLLQIGPGELDVDLGAYAESGGREGKLNGIGYRAGRFPPSPRDLQGADVALVAGRELQRHLPQMPACRGGRGRNDRAQPGGAHGVRAHGGQDEAHRRLIGLFAGELAPQHISRVGDAGDDLLGDPSRRPQRHRELRADPVRGQRGKVGERYVTAGDQSGRYCKNSQRAGPGDVAGLSRHADQTSEAELDEALEPIGKLLLKGDHPGGKTFEASLYVPGNQRRRRANAEGKVAAQVPGDLHQHDGHQRNHHQAHLACGGLHAAVAQMRG